MTTRLDLAIQKYPDHADGIRLLASRDPSGNLKYLDWGAKMLASGQALAPEIADLIDLFHRFRGTVPHARVRLPHSPRPFVVHPDIHAYRPHELATLRAALTCLKRAQDRKRKKRERLYRIEGSMDATIVYDGPGLVVRHIKNKSASVHYGLSTKWCIAMQRENYFTDYETHNATFFFFERKAPRHDEYDKVALMISRTGNDLDLSATAYTSTDQQVDMLMLARVYGPIVFDIFRTVLAASDEYPGSVLFRVYSGRASREELEVAFAQIAQGGVHPYEMTTGLVSICCNDAAPEALLLEVERRAEILWKAAARKRLFRRWLFRRNLKSQGLVRQVQAAIVIHPLVSEAVRERMVKALRRRHVTIEDIRRESRDGRISVTSSPRNRVLIRRNRHRRRNMPMHELRRMVVVHKNRAVRYQKAIKKKLAAMKKKERKKKTQ
jgi:hypothetical protein